MRRSKKPFGAPPKMARGARKWFDICHRAPDFEDAPPLPLTPPESFWLMSMKAGALGYLIAVYAASLEAGGYKVFDHPRPSEFVRGLMACSAVPEEIRRDPEMLRRFPPKKLDGLDVATLVWAPSGTSGQNLAA